MKPPRRPALFILTVILVAGISFPAIRCQDTQPFDVCGQRIQCGETRLEYPFWGETAGRPAYCGRSGFELTCRSDDLLLRYESLSYRVLEIDTHSQTITVARNDFWSNICPQYLYNTTYDTALFNGGNFGQQNVSLYYGCDSSLTSPLGSNFEFDCEVNSTNTDSYFVRTSQIIGDVVNYVAQCNSHITVPVSSSAANQLASVAATTDELRSALTAGFNLQWMANNDECEVCTRNGGRCGSNSTSPALFACYTGSRGSMLKFNWKWKLIIGLSSGITGIMLLLFVIYCRKRGPRETRKAINHQKGPRETREATNHQIEMFIRNHETMAPKQYKYSEIKKMTHSFLEKLGQGGYGSVYKGWLPDGRLVAVKLLGGAVGNGEDFINEVASIGRTSHINIVTLLGYCLEGNKRALIYKFMPNGSLDKFLRSDDDHLDWNTLFRIAKGIARGLQYLHQDCNTRIVHFDIKPHNILLDDEFVPKISDFGLSKLCKKKESIVSITGARGTAGYIAPEVFFKSFGGASHKSDVYSYGMMVLEMTGARKNSNTRAISTSEAYFPDWIYKQVEDGENLGVYGVTTEEEDELARKMMTVSLWCIQSDPSDRPSISKVLEMLEGSLQSLHVPPRRFWSSPTRPPQNSSPSAMQSSTEESVLTVHTS